MIADVAGVVAAAVVAVVAAVAVADEVKLSPLNMC